MSLCCLQLLHYHINVQYALEKKKWILLFLGFFSIVVHYINFVSHVYQVLYILTDFFVCLICESQREALKNLS